MLHGSPVASVPIQQALTSFIAWLTNIGQCVLIGHNVKFDARHMNYHLTENKMTSPFLDVVVGYIDTLPLFKNKYPGMENYRQETLASTLLQINYNAHDALSDSVCLQKLLTMPQDPDQYIKGFGFSAKWFF